METFVRDTITLVLYIGKNLIGFDNLKIKYKDPEGETGQWDAAVTPTDALSMQAQLGSQLSIAGTWKIQAYAESADGTERFHGMWTELKVYTPLHVVD